MNADKIVPCIWLSAEGGKLEAVIEYYVAVFGSHFQTGPIQPLGPTPSGNTEICEVSLFGRRYTLMNTERVHQPLNDTFSLIIYCLDQQEIDHYWEYFTNEGEASQCGWCSDKYGLRWQILPANLGELMGKPHAFEVLMRQRKIVIDEYLG
ncbi:MAG: VOC family protein [Marinilabiliales bacterium]|nr:VOC family protein [Marinilabiliales bacterium]